MTTKGIGSYDFKNYCAIVRDRRSLAHSGSLDQAYTEGTPFNVLISRSLTTVVQSAQTAQLIDYVSSLAPSSYINLQFSNAIVTSKVLTQQLSIQSNSFIQLYDADETNPKVDPYAQVSVPSQSSVAYRVEQMTKTDSLLSMDFFFVPKKGSFDKDDGEVFTFYLATYNSMNQYLIKTSIGYSTSCSTGNQVFASDQLWFNTYTEVDTISQYKRFYIPEFRTLPLGCFPISVSVPSHPNLIIPLCGSPCLQTYVYFDARNPIIIKFTIQVTSPDGESHSFEVTINLHPPGTCGAEILKVSGASPYLLTYPRSDGSPDNEFGQELLSTQIRQLFQSSITTCDFIRFSLYGQVNSNIVPLQYQKISLRSFDDITKDYIQVIRKNFLNMDFKLYGFTSEQNSVSMDLKAIVCGNEVMSMVSSDPRYNVMIRQGSGSGLVDQIPVIETLYTLINSDQTQYCLEGITYRLFSDQALTKPQPCNENLEHNFANKIELLADSVYQSPKLWLQIKTRGQSSIVLQADFTVCPVQTITMTRDQLNLFFDVFSNSPGFVDFQEIYFNDYAWNFQLSSDCSGVCSKNIMEVTLIDPLTGGTFSDGGRTYVNTTTKALMISTSKPRELYSFAIKGYFSHLGCSQIFSNTGLLQIRIQICGNEKVAPKESQPLKLHYIYEKDPPLVSMNRTVLEGLFEVSNTAFCVIKNIELTKNLTSLEPLNGNDNIKKYINIDLKTNFTINIFNDKMQNYTTKIWLVVTTYGNKKAIREIDFDVSYIINQAPNFSEDLIDHYIFTSEVEQIEGLKERLYTYKSPVAKDEELNKVIMTFSGYFLPCNCIEIRQLVTDEFELTVDKTKIKKFDSGNHKVSVSLKDEKYLKTRKVTEYIFTIKIIYLQAEIITELTENLEKNKTEVDLGPKNASEAVQLAISKIWSNGSVDIEFNQNLNIPEIVKKNMISSAQRNLLVNLDNDFIKQNVLVLEIFQNSELPEVSFNFAIDYWTQKGMQISLEFENPQFVSHGQKPDRLQISIIGPEYFRSNISGEILLEDKVTFFKSIPKQIHGGVLVEDLKDEAVLTTEALTGLIASQIFAQVLLKTSMDDLWALFLSLQMICYVSYYDVIIPLNAEFYMIELKKLVEFQILNPEGLIRLFDPEFKLSNFFQNVKTSIVRLPSDEVLPETLFVDLRIFIYLLVLAFVGLLILLFLYRIPFIKQKTLYFLVILREKMLWNGVIRSLSIAYLKLGIAIGIQFKLWKTHFAYQGLPDKSVACLIGFFMVGYAVFTIYFLKKNKRKLNKKQFQDKYVNFYKNIKTKKKLSIFLYPVFLVRRILFVCFPLVLMNFATFQCICLIFMSELYIVAYAVIKPHVDPRIFIVEMTNEIMNLSCFFLLLFFNDISLSPTMFDLLGLAFIQLTVGMIAFNILNMLLSLYQSNAKSKRIWRMKKLAVIRNQRQIELNQVIAARQIEENKKTEDEEESSESEASSSKSSLEKDSFHITIQDQSEYKRPQHIKTSNKINVVNQEIFKAYSTPLWAQAQNTGFVNTLGTQAFTENDMPILGKIIVQKQIFEEPGQFYEQHSDKYELPKDDEDLKRNMENSIESEETKEQTRLKKLGTSIIFRQPNDPNTNQENKDYTKAQKKWIQISQPGRTRSTTSAPSNTPKAKDPPKALSFYDLAQMQLEKDKKNEDLEKGHTRSFGGGEQNLQVEHNLPSRSFYTGNLSSMEFYEMPKILNGGPDAPLTKIQLKRRENAVKREKKQFE